MATSRIVNMNAATAPVFPGETLHVAAASDGILRRPAARVISWIVCDLATVSLAALISLELRLRVFSDHAGAFDTISTFLGREATALAIAWFACLLVIVSRSYGLYGPMTRCSGLHEQRLNMQAALTAGLLLAGTLYLTRLEIVSRTVVLLTIAITAGLLAVRRGWWRYVIYKRHEHGVDVRNILIVGTSHVSKSLRSHLEAIRHLGFNFKGYIQFSPADREAPQEEILGSVHELISVARANFVDEIFVATPCERGMVKRIVSEAMEAGIDVRVVPDLYDGLAWGAPVEYLGQFPTIPLHRRGLPVTEQVAKRAIDIAAALIGLALLSPVLLIIAILVKLDSPGPILYAAERIGKRGRKFECIKFRTMVRDAEERKADIYHMNERDGVIFKIRNDPRVTKLGKVLRKYSLDELPQLYNVLCGEMSLVGPRPPVASEVQQYELMHLRRLAVSPGITGLWQVEARQDPSFDSYISFDTAYVENWSLWLDVKILVRTIGVVLAGTGT
jgi:exopolysaccharide biosynthesis polyprenyl glycosylphosphotransferase